MFPTFSSTVNRKFSVRGPRRRFLLDPETAGIVRLLDIRRNARNVFAPFTRFRGRICVEPWRRSFKRFSRKPRFVIEQLGIARETDVVVATLARGRGEERGRRVDGCFVVVGISVPSVLSLSPPLRFTFARSQFRPSSPLLLFFSNAYGRKKRSE